MSKNKNNDRFIFMMIAQTNADNYREYCAMLRNNSEENERILSEMVPDKPK